MKKLYITFAEARQQYGSESFNPVSRFVRDIPAALVEEVRLSGNISRPTSYAGVTQSARVEDPGLNLGQRVVHGSFGEGVILNVEGSGAQTRVQVKFDQVGAKWLVLQYARLAAI